MVLSNQDIKAEIKRGRLKFFPKLSEDQIGPSSVDLTLSGTFWVFKGKYLGKTVDLSKVGFQQAIQKHKGNCITLAPGQMCLGVTKERISMPNDLIGTLEGRSRYARMGLAVHVTSALVHPGSNNRQVLEIVNFAPFAVTIKEGMRISQVVFERLETPTSMPYSKYGKVARKQ
ncbi:MAG: dCTP deaminase [Candidatus Anstonellaceae archaeon]